MRNLPGILFLAVGLMSGTFVAAAAQNQRLAFEVASVKSSPSSTGFAVSFGLCHGIDTQLPVLPPGAPITVPALGFCVIRRLSLMRMVSFAYPSIAAVLP